MSAFADGCEAIKLQRVRSLQPVRGGYYFGFFKFVDAGGRALRMPTCVDGGKAAAGSSTPKNQDISVFSLSWCIDKTIAIGERSRYVMSIMDSKITAVLGPTNTGKTHLAIERMLGHSSGIMGFPLRLLAREVYDQIRTLKGAALVGLVTGEERILPKTAQWLVATVEAMPLDRPYSFVAIDEAQLIADSERGHIFTDRLLKARGIHETMILGSNSLAAVVNSLFHDQPQPFEIISRPRFSELRHHAPMKIERLPRRSAIIGFSASEIYRLADELRRIHGGCAVIMGNLSPRARNAQLALYQSGEVDYLVATDAIGMGLNLDLAHVAFASLSKFDGKQQRPLRLGELAQIAGRAGRYRRDGSFGTTAGLPDLAPDVCRAIEDHQFKPLERLWWRNSDLDFRSIDRLLASLDQPPPLALKQRLAPRQVSRKIDADDQLVLQLLATDSAITNRLHGRESLSLLWEACQIPDFTKKSIGGMGSHHAQLVTLVFQQLSSKAAAIGRDWMVENLTRLDVIDGDIEQLSLRLSQIRTFAYIAHRDSWLVEPQPLQSMVREIEDRLSDALHQRLTQLYVDRRASVLTRHLEQSGEIRAIIEANGTVTVDSVAIGRLEGLAFVVDGEAASDERKRLMTVARRALRPELLARLGLVLRAQPSELKLRHDGAIDWQFKAGENPPQLWHLARLEASGQWATPRVRLERFDLLEPNEAEQVRMKLERFVKEKIDQALGGLFQLSDLPFADSGTAKSLKGVFAATRSSQLTESIDSTVSINSIPANDSTTATHSSLSTPSTHSTQSTPSKNSTQSTPSINSTQSTPSTPSINSKKSINSTQSTLSTPSINSKKSINSTQSTPLINPKHSTKPTLSGAARGLAYLLAEQGGWLSMSDQSGTVQSLTKSDRQQLTKAGLRFGLEFIYWQGLFLPAAQRLLRLLAALEYPGEESVAYWQRCGYACLRHGKAIRYLRIDRLEAIKFTLRRQGNRHGNQGAFSLPQQIRQQQQLHSQALEVEFLAMMGYQPVTHPDGASAVKTATRAVAGAVKETEGKAATRAVAETVRETEGTAVPIAEAAGKATGKSQPLVYQAIPRSKKGGTQPKNYPPKQMPPTKINPDSPFQLLAGLDLG